MAEIVISGLTKTYPDKRVAVQDLNLGVADGEFLVLVGPSGCGKSTVLRCVAGLEQPLPEPSPWAAEIDHLPPQSRDLAMVFQTYALYPHLSVLRESRLRVNGAGRAPGGNPGPGPGGSRKLAILPHLHKKPRELSGGERQRVASGQGHRPAAPGFFDG